MALIPRNKLISTSVGLNINNRDENLWNPVRGRKPAISSLLIKDLKHYENLWNPVRGRKHYLAKFISSNKANENLWNPVRGRKLVKYYFL